MEFIYTEFFIAFMFFYMLVLIHNKKRILINMPKEQDVSNNSDLLTPVSKGLDNLFKSLIALQRQLTPLFSNEVSQLDAQQLQDIEDFYHTVSDKNGVLSLQLKNSPEMQAKVKFLSTKAWREDIKGALKGYVPGIAVGGGSGLVVAGLCIEATVEASAVACITEGVVEGALLGARVFNPWFIVPSAVFMGTSWFSSYMARQLSFTIIRALGLYEEAKKSNDTKLVEAEKILKAELGEGPSGRYKFSRFIRYPSTSNEQFEFITLLLAQIHLKQELDGCYEQFQEVIDKSTNKNIKGMALVGQLDMLSPTSKWTFYKKGTVGLHKEAMSFAERIQLFYPKAKELNRSHKELIELYFNRIWSAYNSMLDAVANGVCLRSSEEFLEQQLAINKMINFQGVNILHYMGENGKLAEILLTFIQGVCYVMHDTHNKYINQQSNDEYAAHSDRDESELAKQKFNKCLELINKFNSEEFSGKHELEQDIFRIIRRYTEQYFDSCADVSEEKLQVVRPPVLINVAYERHLQRLSHNDAEKVADNSLRDEKNPSKALREAKVSFAKIKHNKG